MAIRSSSGFSHHRSGVFRISLRTHKTQHTQPRGWKKREQTNTDLGYLQAQEGRRLWYFPSILSICGLACIRAKFPQSHKECWLIFSGWPTRPWVPTSLQSPTLSNWLPCSASFSWLTASSDFCRLPCSVDWSVLPPSLFWFLLLTLEPFFPRPLPVSWEISRASPLCRFRAKTDKRIYWLALTHTHTTNAQHRVTLLQDSYYSKLLIVSNLPLISRSPILFSRPLRTVLKAQATIGITITSYSTVLSFH